MIGAFGHTYDAIVTNPDCENGGYTTYICCNCGDEYVDGEPLESEETSEENATDSSCLETVDATVSAIETGSDSKNDVSFGCGASIGTGALAVVIIAGVLGAVIMKKKDEEA